VRAWGGGERESERVRDVFVCACASVLVGAGWCGRMCVCARGKHYRRRTIGANWFASADRACTLSAVAAAPIALRLSGPAVFRSLMRVLNDTYMRTCVGFIQVCMCTQKNARMYACMHVCMYVYTYICIYVRTYVRDARMHACMYVDLLKK
jgi:hypothetical protein